MGEFERKSKLRELKDLRKYIHALDIKADMLEVELEHSLNLSALDKKR